MKKQTKLKAIQMIVGIITIVIMAITACSMEAVPGKDGKDGIDGKSGADGVDGADGTDGKNGVDGKAPSSPPIWTLWLRNFPVIVEDRTAGVMVERNVKAIQAGLDFMASATTGTNKTTVDNIIGRSAGNMRYIVEDVPDPGYTWSDDPSRNERRNWRVEDGRTVYLRVRRLEIGLAEGVIRQSMLVQATTALPDLTKK